jgi:hypothetical protein
MVDEVTRKTLSGIPLLKTKAGPKDDPKLWIQRLKEEYQALIKVGHGSRSYSHLMAHNGSRVTTFMCSPSDYKVKGHLSKFSVGISCT